MSQSVMAQSQSLSDWLSYLERIHPTVIDLGLHRVGVVADRLGLRQLPARVVTVGGTNGKGTTCAVLESIYRAAGYRVGVYASPHLLRYNERVRLLGEEASDQALCDAMAAVEEIVKQLPKGVGYSWTGLSYEERLAGSQAPALYALSILEIGRAHV